MQQAPSRLRVLLSAQPVPREPTLLRGQRYARPLLPIPILEAGQEPILWFLLEPILQRVQEPIVKLLLVIMDLWRVEEVQSVLQAMPALEEPPYNYVLQEDIHLQVLQRV